MSPFFRPNKRGKARLLQGARLTSIRRAEYGTFYADYYDSAKARRRVKLPACSTWEEAKRLEAELQADGFRRAHSLAPRVRVSITTAQLVERYRAAETAAQHPPRRVALNHLVRLLGNRAAAELTPADCQAMLTTMLNEGYAPGTVNTQRIVNSAVWTWGIEKLQALQSSPWPATTPEDIPSRALRHLHEEAAWRLLLALKPRDKAFVYLGALTGARAGEVLPLRWGDFLWEEGAHGAVHIRKSGQRDLTKTKRARLVPLHPALRALLHPMRGAPDALLFPTRRGTLRKGWHAAREVREAARRAGVTLPEGFTYHDLRRTFATAILKRTGNLVAAQRLLGHSSPRVTEAYYLGRDAQMLEDAVGALGPVDGHSADTRDSAPEGKHPRNTGKGQ